MVSRRTLAAVVVAGAAALGIVLAIFVIASKFHAKRCEGRQGVFPSRVPGPLTVWREEGTGALYYVRSAQATDPDAGAYVGGIRGLILLRGTGGGRLADPHGVTALKFDSLELLTGQLLGGLGFYRELRRQALGGECAPPPPAIRTFLNDSTPTPRPRSEQYASPLSAQRRVSWPIVWGGRRLAGIPYHSIVIERAGPRTSTATVFYGPEKFNLREMKAASPRAGYANARLRKGIRVGPARVLDVAHRLPPLARVGSTIVELAADHRRTRSEWIAIVRTLRVVRSP